MALSKVHKASLPDVGYLSFSARHTMLHRDAEGYCRTYAAQQLYNTICNTVVNIKTETALQADRSAQPCTSPIAVP
jgi:hypothetical protein